MKKHPVPPPENDDVTAVIIGRIAQLTCVLRESIHELAVDKVIVEAVQSIPDANDRLAYVIKMTTQAAERALSCVEAAQPHQDELESSAQKLTERWDAWFANPIEITDARALVTDTRDYLKQVPEHTEFTRTQLREIMMAQDFQDLTGQVIKRMMDMIRNIENQLMIVLKENAPDSLKNKRSKSKKTKNRLPEGRLPENNPPQNDLLNGPQIDKNAEGTVATQDQVDDLLDSLGF